MSGILGEHESVEALRELAVTKGFVGPGQAGAPDDGGQFRRAAWLYLLGLPPQPTTTQSKPKGTTSDLLQQSQQLHSQLDSDGWQLTRDFNLNQSIQSGQGDDLGWIHTQAQNGNDKDKDSESEGWQTATSKRSKRIKTSFGSESGSAGGNHPHHAQEDEHDRVQAGSRESNTTASSNSSPSNSNSPSILAKSLSNNRFNLDDEALDQAGKSTKSRKKAKKRSRKNKDKDHVSNDDENHANGGTQSGHDGRDGQEIHRDERQVELDIMRSFVGFKDGPLKDSEIRERRRDQLREIVIGVLRRHPALNYFQGYHDILSILLLTLNPTEPPSSMKSEKDSNSHMSSSTSTSASASASTSTSTSSDSPRWSSTADRDLTLKACERISLHFVRDSMTENMDPVMGQLKVIRNILRLADKELASKVEQASPLPFFALPWVLTLLSHDLPFEVTQMIFDFIISHGPSSLLYLCVSIILTKKETLDNEPDLCSDPAFLHQYLSQLPDFQVQSQPQPQPRSDGSSTPVPISKKEEKGDPNSNSESTKVASDSAHQVTPDLMTESEHLERVEIQQRQGQQHVDEEEEEEEEDNNWERKREPMKLELETILKRSREMMESHPLQSVAHPMGKKSVLWTWQEIFSDQHGSVVGNGVDQEGIQIHGSSAWGRHGDSHKSKSELNGNQNQNENGKENENEHENENEGVNQKQKQKKNKASSLSPDLNSTSTDRDGTESESGGNQVTSPASHSSSNARSNRDPIPKSPLRKPESIREEDWRLHDSFAEEAVSGEISQVVKDPRPSPPTSVAGDEPSIFDYSKEYKGFGKGENGREGRGGGKEKKNSFGMTTAATVVGVAGVLLAVYSASSSSGANSNGQITRQAIGLAGSLLGLGEDW